MNTLNKILVTIGLCLSLGACGTTEMRAQPNYALIEFGAVSTFTVIVNETMASENTTLKAYRGLEELEKVLVVNKTVLDLHTIDQILANAVPVEYRTLAYAGSKLVRSRVRAYMQKRLPDSLITEHEVTVKVALAVIQGAKSALQSKQYFTGAVMYEDEI